MAEATGLRNNALPYPVYGVPYGVSFPILDADGDLVTGATGLDSEVSKNGDTFADCTNEATEIATSSGVYYLLLTASEMTADVVTVIVKTSSSGAKTTTLVLYPRKLVALATGTAQGGAAGYITLAASTTTYDDELNGLLCVAVLDSATEARIIADSTASNQQAAVTPSWNTTPDSDDTYTIYLPEGRQFPTGDTRYWNKLATVELPLVPTTAGRKLDVSAGGEAGLDWANVGSPSTTVGLSGTTVKAVTDAVALPATATIAITGNITGNLSGSVGSVTGNVGGNVTGSVGSLVGHTAQTGDSYAIVSSGTHGNAALKTLIDTVDTVVDAILVDTAEIGAAGAGLTALASAVNLATTNTYAAEVHKATVAAASVTVAASPSPTTTTFGSDRTEANDFWNDARVKFLTGALTGQSRVVLDYANSGGTFTLDEALTSAPSAGDTFILVSDHLHSITQIQDGLATAANLATLTAYVDTEVASILAAVDTEVAAIKAKTDQLTFTVANQVDSNALTVVGTVDDAVLSAIAALSIPTAVQIRTEIDSNSTQLASILADTDSLDTTKITTARAAVLTDWIDGGRLDLILDARASQASVDDLPTNAELATALGTADDATLAAIAALSIPSATTIADAVLSRNVSNVEASAGEHTLCTTVLAMLESSISGTTWTIKRTNGSTTHATKTVTTDAAADPVTGVS